MRIVYEGDNPPFPLEISKDNVVLDPANEASVIQVIVVIYARMGQSAALAKYALRPLDEHTSMSIIGGKAVFYLTSAITTACVNKELVMQISTILADATHPEGQDKKTSSSVFCKVLPKVK